MRLLLGLLVAGALWGQDRGICGKEAEGVAVYCYPDLSSLGTMFFPGQSVQVWVRGEAETPKRVVVRLAHRVGEELRYQWALAEGPGVAMARFVVEELRPEAVEVFDLDSLVLVRL